MEEHRSAMMIKHIDYLTKPLLISLMEHLQRSLDWGRDQVDEPGGGHCQLSRQHPQSGDTTCSDR